MGLGSSIVTAVAWITAVIWVQSQNFCKPWVKQKKKRRREGERENVGGKYLEIKEEKNHSQRMEHIYLAFEGYEYLFTKILILFQH